MTYKTLITLFESFAVQHPFLQGHFSWGNLSDYQRNEYIQQYPALHIVPYPSTLADTATYFTFNIVIFDLNNEWADMSANSNQLDSLSLCHEILNDFYNWFINQLTQYGYYLQTPFQFSPISDRWKESVVGVEAQITIISDQTACIPPL